jgi:hypothetical protein
VTQAGAQYPLNRFQYALAQEQGRVIRTTTKQSPAVSGPARHRQLHPASSPLPIPVSCCAAADTATTVQLPQLPQLPLLRLLSPSVSSGAAAHADVSGRQASVMMWAPKVDRTCNRSAHSEPATSTGAWALRGRTPGELEPAAFLASCDES